MRFHRIEMVPGRDPDAVLRAMEEGLREVSIELVREGQRITLAGLGPSPRAKNKRDRTVIDVSAEDGTTTIAVDVTYQASAFLGEAPQDAVVQAKLDRVFDRMRTQLGLERRPVSVWNERPKIAEPVARPEELPVMRFSAMLHDERPPVATAAPLVDPVPAAGSAPTEETPLPEPAVTAPVEAVAVETDSPAMEEAAKEREDSAAGEGEEAAAKTEEIAPEKVEETEAAVETAEVTNEDKEEESKGESPAPPAAPASSGEKQPEAVKETDSAAIEEVSATATALTERRPVQLPRPPRRHLLPEIASVPADLVASDAAKKKPLFSVPTAAPTQPAAEIRSSLPNFAKTEEEAKGSKVLKWSAWAAAIVVLVLAPAAWLYLPRDSGGDQTPAQAQGQAAPAAAPAPVAAAQQASTPQPAPVQTAVPGSEEDPAAAVKDWESAMQSSDAAKQAGFYADPVDRYFLRHNVSHADVLADRQAQIAKRKGEWSVTMERVKVKQQPDANAATVQLVKHFTIRQDGKLTSQWFVPSQLLLKRADGRWQITSERDMGWAPTMDELDSY